MNKWQRKCIASALILLFIGPLFGLLSTTLTNSPLASPLASGRIHSAFDYNTASAINGLSNQIVSGDIISIDPGENITGAIISNLTFNGGNQFTVQNSTSNCHLQFSIIDSILNTDSIYGFNIKGSPNITATNIFIAGPLQSNSYPSQIGTPTLILDNVTASKMQFRVSGGTFTCSNSNITSLVLNGFTTATLNSDNISKSLTVAGSGIVYIYSCSINGTILESVKPTISCQTLYTVSYSYVFQPQVQLEIALGGSDNIRGPAYAVHYSLDIYKNGNLHQSIPNYASDSYSLTVDTTANYEIHLTCLDNQGNISEETIIVIITEANLLWFILMIVIIAAGAVAAIAIFFMWKQRQWQKTALVEIPA